VELVATKDPRAKGLATKRRVALEEYLEERGFLSNEEPFDDAELVTEVTSALGGAVFGHDSAEAHARLRDAAMLVRLWTGLLHHGDDAA
jgi:acetaldehyde dehydrogenase (acetylating)